MPSSLYKGHRYPAEIISHCVWLYHRFPLSFREVEEMMMARGVIVSYETIRGWFRKFGQSFAHQLRRRRPRPGDKWHLDEVFITINGKRQYLWRAVDQDGHALDIVVTALWQPMPSVEHRQSRYLNNRAENSHQPTQQREHAMKKFASPVAPNDSCPHSAGYHRTSGPAATETVPEAGNSGTVRGDGRSG